MLQIETPIPFWVAMPYKTVAESVISSELFTPEHVHLITDNGLIPSQSASSLKPVPLRFVFVTQRLPEDTMGGCPEVSCFIERFTEFLKANGAVPAYEKIRAHPQPAGVPKFIFWFDVSSETSKAYYKVATMRGGGGLVVAVLCRELDPIVIGNMQFLDEILGAIMRMCIDPWEACIQCLTKK